MKSTEREDHADKCPYKEWLDSSGRWQPNLPEGGRLHPLSQVVREVVRDTYCTCGGSDEPS